MQRTTIVTTSTVTAAAIGTALAISSVGFTADSSVTIDRQSGAATSTSRSLHERFPLVAAKGNFLNASTSSQASSQASSHADTSPARIAADTILDAPDTTHLGTASHTAAQANEEPKPSQRRLTLLDDQPRPADLCARDIQVMDLTARKLLGCTFTTVAWTAGVVTDTYGRARTDVNTVGGIATSTVEGVTDLVEDTRDTATDAVADTVEQVTDTVGQVTDTVTEVAEAVVETADGAVTTATETTTCVVGVARNVLDLSINQVVSCA